MARDGVWRKLDAALTWHPEDMNEVRVLDLSNSLLSRYSINLPEWPPMLQERRRRAAVHWMPVELMNIGVQFLREHMSDRARIHYAITDAGGCSPNVVQPRASVLYMVRSNHVSEAVELQARVIGLQRARH